MKKLICLILISVVFQLVINAQEAAYHCMNEEAYTKYFERKLVGKLFINQFISDNLQFYNDWTIGEIIFNDSTIIKNKFLRYNGYIDGLLWLRENDYQVCVLNREDIAGFNLYNKNNEVFTTFKNIMYKDWLTNDSAQVYMQVLTEGKISLYIHRRVRRETHTNKLYEHFVYYLYKDGVFHPLKLGRVSLIRLFPEKEDKEKLRSILWKNKFRVKYEQDLVKAIEIYNSISNN